MARARQAQPHTPRDPVGKDGSGNGGVAGSGGVQARDYLTTALPGTPSPSETARRITALLASEAYRDGDPIPSERALAASLQVPRSVVREALRALTLIGLLESHPGRPTRIHAATSEWVGTAIEWGLLLGMRRTWDLVEARSYVEVASAALAAERRDDRDVAGLQALVEEMRRSERDRPHLVHLDVEFHMGLARAARNDVLYHLLVSLGALLEVWISRVLAGQPTQMLDEYPEHAELLAAVETGNVERARTLMAAAMQRGEDSLRLALRAGRQRPIATGRPQLLTLAGQRPRSAAASRS